MRPYPDRPVVGVGAVVLDGQRVLLVKRGHAPLKGQWSLPGGGVETGETLEQAVAREVLEETGVTIEVGPIVEVLDRISRDSDGRVEHHFVLVDFVARPSGGFLRSASDAEDAEWVQLSDLQKYEVAPVTMSVIQKASSRGFDIGERPLVW
ncbi:MAG TPA: NUDIX hydrolase [Vicinamibacterales bacterium]|nr:NUDIX hydrolase [Vicinamibacterales bacterium]